MQWIVSPLCLYTCDQHTYLQMLSNWRSPYLRPSAGFANGISWYLTKYSSLYLNGSMYTLHHLAHTLVSMYLAHTDLCTVPLYSCPEYHNMAHNTLLTRTCDILVTQFILLVTYLFLLELLGSLNWLFSNFLVLLTDSSWTPWFYQSHLKVNASWVLICF